MARDPARDALDRGRKLLNRVRFGQVTADTKAPQEFFVLPLKDRGTGDETQLGVLGEGSPIQGFLDKNPSGGIHHVCYEVDDILAARDRLKEQGARVLGSGEPKIGAHGKPVLFLHPKDFCGTLVELEEA